ncbi:hypothetical protein BG004_006125 [Podila humilis]|nr:hypothetical protein BG004_006125 [Podila humilis]
MFLSPIVAADNNHSFSTMNHSNTNINNTSTADCSCPRFAIIDAQQLSLHEQFHANLNIQQQLPGHPAGHSAYSIIAAGTIADPGLQNQSQLLAMGHSDYTSPQPPPHECLCDGCMATFHQQQHFIHVAGQSMSHAMNVPVSMAEFQRDHSADSASTDSISSHRCSGSSMVGLHVPIMSNGMLSDLPASTFFPPGSQLLSSHSELRHQQWHDFYVSGQYQDYQVNPFSPDQFQENETDSTSHHSNSASPGPADSVTIENQSGVITIATTTVAAAAATTAAESPNERPLAGKATSAGRVYTCPFPDCGKTYPRKPTLKTHINTHRPYRPYTCEICARSFTRYHDRDRHSRIHNPRQSVCIVCLATFARQDAVTRHLKGKTCPCGMILKAKGLPLKDVAAGRIDRSALGDEEEIQGTYTLMAEELSLSRSAKTKDEVLEAHAKYYTEPC